MSQAFGGWVLDHHAVSAWARVEPYAQALVWSAMEVGMVVVLPVAVLPLAYAAISESEHGAVRLLRELPVTVVDPLEPDDAPELGRILAANPDTSDDVAAASVVYAARRRGAPVLTGRAAELRALAPELELDELP